MTLEDARAIWLTLIGSDWVGRYELMNSPHYYSTLQPAYTVLRMAASLDVDLAADKVKLKCKS
jgi:hypothetical protein